MSWAAHADEVDEEAADVTDWLLAAAAPAAGETLLEVGAGPGGVGLAAADAVRPGRVILTDIAPPMIDVARERVVRLGLENVDLEVADATALPLPDGVVDAVVSRFALQAMDDPGRALAESTPHATPSRGDCTSRLTSTPPTASSSSRRRCSP